MPEFDIGIRADYLLTMAGGAPTVIHDGFVGILGPQIAAVGAWEADKYAAKRMIHARGRAVMPGLINGHTHLAMSLFRGLADDLPFVDWLTRVIMPMEAKFVSPEFVRIGSELGLLESIRAGVTTVCDMYYFEDAVAEAVDRSGARGIVCEAFADFAAPDNKNRDESDHRIMERMLERFQNHERVIPALGPHAPYTCSDATLKRMRDLALSRSLKLSIHISESRHEVEESIKNFGKTPVQRVADLGLLEAQPIIAHGTQLTDREIDLLARHGGSVIYNPESNMKLGAGVTPVPKLLAQGVPVGIGTDGAASNNDLSLFREMDSGAKLQKLHHADNTAMTAVQALRLATWGGARALGLQDKIGSLEPGKLADLIVIDLQRPHMQPLHDLPSQLVYAATGQEVETVICHGRVIFENGQPTQLDAAKIFDEASELGERIRGNLA